MKKGTGVCKRPREGVFGDHWLPGPAGWHAQTEGVGMLSHTVGGTWWNPPYNFCTRCQDVRKLRG
ncbi:MAG: hypothetical protein MI923_13760 [Phycisphaerales bacterium]|nr:hypothetical protein [Phycisphaerales bacterium]